MTLFEEFDEKAGTNYNAFKFAPLAERMRPNDLSGFIGQEHLVGTGKVLEIMISEDRLFSMILWGPPGCGKTTLAKIIASKTKSRFISYSAVTSGIKQIKEVMELAQAEKKTRNKRTILFIDEIHRFNKAQQDAFLPYVEDGTIILIGATTENPSFEVISALLSRCKVFVLNKLSPQEIEKLINLAISDKEKGLGNCNIEIDDSTITFIANFCDGDSRIAYNILDIATGSVSNQEDLKDPGRKKTKPFKIDILLIENIIQKKALLYDKNGEEHFNLISALHKSMRGSDPDASVYWTMRMIESGEDPLYIIRRMVRFASEDIGLADPGALKITLAAKDAFDFIGPPEGYLAILQAVIYLSLAPKSNAVYTTYSAVMEDIKNFQSLPVPLHIRNAPTKLMKDIGYSRGYIYPHNHENAVVYQSYLPHEIKKRRYYNPTGRGFEKELKSRLEKIDELKEKFRQNPVK
jgi:putative ATPase